ncbi:MAG: hypothetical protein ACE366_15480 [Bradymonadia bacterium]
MSRGYRLRLPTRPVVRSEKDVNTSDALSMQVDLLPILSPEEMSTLLRQALIAQGWSEKGDRVVLNQDGVQIALEPDGRSIVIKGTRSARVTGTATDKASAQAAAKLQAERAKASMSQTLAKDLLKTEAAVREAIEKALQGVYVEALKRKAASMGEIESVHEGTGADGQSELTIKIKV